MRNCSLCIIIDRGALGGRDIIKAVDEMLRGGADIIQYRNKSSSDKDFVKEASVLRLLTKAYGRIFIINDRVDAALAVHADGVHLGQEDMPIRYARAMMRDKIIGISAHNHKDAMAAERDGADYIGIGPVFKTQNKKGTKPIGLAAARKAVAATHIPAFAIGGISIKNIAALKAAGIGKITVISAAINSRNICNAVALLKQELES